MQVEIGVGGGQAMLEKHKLVVKVQTDGAPEVVWYESRRALREF
jgi:hypothetical protein